MTTAPARPTTAATTPPTLPPFNHAPAPYTGPSKDEVLAMRREFLTPRAASMVSYRGGTPVRSSETIAKVR